MTPPASTALDPPAFLQLAGHPLRWRLLVELARSDRRVHELTALVGEPQNLVSYHLGKLRDAGLVRARRSSADRRDSYYAVDLGRIGEHLTGTGLALHAGLRLEPSAAAPPKARRRKPGVLFLCTGNSARSQMAEALARARSGGLVAAHSAGSNPKALHADAIRVMREEHGIDLAEHRPKHLGAFARRRFDRVVTLCDRVREVCPPFPGRPEALHWSIPDPSAEPVEGGEGYGAFRRTAEELDTRVGFLIATLVPPDPA